MYETYYIPKLVMQPDDLEERECHRCGEPIDKKLINEAKYTAEFERPEKGDSGDGWRITHLWGDCVRESIRNSNHVNGLLESTF